ncbi:hypothetical protein AAMO2058_001203100, partial [Amorphochlora amoebiformis]
GMHRLRPTYIGRLNTAWAAMLLHLLGGLAGYWVMRIQSRTMSRAARLVSRPYEVVRIRISAQTRLVTMREGATCNNYGSVDGSIGALNNGRSVAWHACEGWQLGTTPPRIAEKPQ